MSENCSQHAWYLIPRKPQLPSSHCCSVLGGPLHATEEEASTALDMCFEILHGLAAFGVTRAEDLQRISSFEFRHPSSAVKKSPPKGATASRSSTSSSDDNSSSLNKKDNIFAISMTPRTEERKSVPLVEETHTNVCSTTISEESENTEQPPNLSSSLPGSRGSSSSQQQEPPQPTNLPAHHAQVNNSPSSDATLFLQQKVEAMEGMLKCIGDSLHRHLCTSQRDLRGGGHPSLSSLSSASAALQHQDLRGGDYFGKRTIHVPAAASHGAQSPSICLADDDGHSRVNGRSAWRRSVSVVDPEINIGHEESCAPLDSVRTTRYHRSRTASSVYGSVVFNRPEVSETNRVVIGRDEDDNKVINDYVILGELGRGSFGKVKLAEHAVTKTVHAIKIVKAQTLAKRAALSRGGADGSVRDKLLREIAVMKKVAHPNLVQLHEVMSDEEKGKIYMVMQYIPCGTIAVKTSPTTVCPVEPTLLRKYAAQMISALRALHRNGIFHRDVKPDNILLGEHDCVYVADFGVSVICSEDGVSGVEGTPAFMAPELCRGELSVGGEAVDAWALGVTLFQLMYGVLPFHGETHLALTRRIVNDELVFPEREGVEPAPDGFVELLRGLLTKDPSQRWSLRQASRCTWIRGTEPSLQIAAAVIPWPPSDASAQVRTLRNRRLVLDSDALLSPRSTEDDTNENDETVARILEADIAQALSPVKACREGSAAPETARATPGVGRRLMDARQTFMIGRALQSGVFTPEVLNAATTTPMTGKKNRTRGL